MFSRVIWLTIFAVSISVSAHAQKLVCKSVKRHACALEKCETIDLVQRVLLDLHQGIEICDDNSCQMFAGEFEISPVISTAVLKTPRGQQYYATYQPQFGLLSVAVPLYAGSFGIVVSQCEPAG